MFYGHEAWRGNTEIQSNLVQILCRAIGNTVDEDWLESSGGMLPTGTARDTSR